MRAACGPDGEREKERSKIFCLSVKNPETDRSQSRAKKLAMEPVLQLEMFFSQGKTRRKTKKMMILSK